MPRELKAYWKGDRGEPGVGGTVCVAAHSFAEAARFFKMPVWFARKYLRDAPLPQEVRAVGRIYRQYCDGRIVPLCICGKPLNKGHNTFCMDCQKLPRDEHGFPIRSKS